MTAQLSVVSELTLAHRIQRAHNAEIAKLAPTDFARPGWLIFDARGRLLRWYNASVILNPGDVLVEPTIARGEIPFRLHPTKVRADEVLAFLQARGGTTPHRDAAELYPSASKPVEERADMSPELGVPCIAVDPLYPLREEP